MTREPEPVGCENVRVAARGRTGRLTLDRPARLNALTPDMVACIAEALDAWRSDDGVRSIVIDGNGPRGFCAGGDIRFVRDSAHARDGAAQAFWANEYRLNVAIADYPKPIVALMPGIVMGGGVGLGAHARLRVVMETTALAMPETKIGIIPDVGGTYLLARAPRNLGTYVALTGATIGAADAIALGLADAFVPADRVAALTEALVSAADASQAGLRATIDRFTAPVPSAILAEHVACIERAFAHDRVEAILGDLMRDGSAFALDAAKRIRANSPTAVKLTLRALREVAAGGDDLRAALAREFRMMSRLVCDADFSEGIRAAIVDKDRAPVWNPARLSDVREKSLDRYFAPLGERELLCVNR